MCACAADSYDLKEILLNSTTEVMKGSLIAVILVVMMNYTLTDVTGINMMLTRVVECVVAVGVARCV